MYQENTQQKIENTGEVKKIVSIYLSPPERVRHSESDLTQKLGSFLVDVGQIQAIDVWDNSWGFMYKDKTIYMSGSDMPRNAYEYYVFRLGVDPYTGRHIFPNESETDQYRFLHEVGHAYQEYLTKVESPEDPELWYTKVRDGKIDSNYSLLWKFCFKNRLEGNYGFSTWGNVPEYSKIKDPQSQTLARAMEDANELVNMYLWNPEYLKTYLNYLSGSIPGYGDLNLEHDKLGKITETQKRALFQIVKEYVSEMKEHIRY